MILDSLKNSHFHEHLNPLLPKAFEYIKSLNFKDLEIGKVEVDGLNLFVMISDSSLKEQAEAKLEAHNKYIDIQIPISKTERFGWAPREVLIRPVGEFDKTKDIQFFNDTAPVFFDLAPENFVIFFPHDAHAPCIGEGIVRKIVVKIRIQQ